MAITPYRKPSFSVSLNKRKIICAYSLLVIIIFSSTLTAQKTDDKPYKTYENSGCGIIFGYPRAWLVKDQDTGYKGKDQLCALRVQPKDLAQRLKDNDNIDIYSIEIYISNLDFSHAAESVGFERREKGWVVVGNYEQPAHEISSPQWVGVRGMASTRCYYEGGGYAGVCDLLRAVLNNRSNLSAVIQGPPEQEEFFNYVLSSFTFTKPIPRKNVAPRKGAAL